MRIPTNTFSNTLINHLGRLTGRQQVLQAEAATGQKIRLPEDNPVAVARVLDMEAESRAVGQYQNNIARLLEQSTVSYDAMRGLKRISDRAGELAVLADGNKPADQLRLYAAEVTELIDEAFNLANKTHRGEYLFGGVKSDQPPFAAARNAEGQITAVTYQGSESASKVEVAQGTTLSVQVIGVNTTGSGPRGLLADAASGSDFFQHLIALQDQLLAGDTDVIASTTIGNLRKDEDNFIYHFGDLGALQTRLETTRDVMVNQTDALDTLISKEADADLAETLVRLSETQNAYMAALQSGASVLKQSLMDFLR
jgi:flagellar hook-associated protein 3 FlgL